MAATAARKPQRGNRRRAAAAARRQQWRRRDGRGTAATISAHGELEIILFTSTCKGIGKSCASFPSINQGRTNKMCPSAATLGGWVGRSDATCM